MKTSTESQNSPPAAHPAPVGAAGPGLPATTPPASGVASPAQPSTPETPRSKMERVAALLRGEPVDPPTPAPGADLDGPGASALGADPTAEPAAPGAGGELDPLSLEALAAALQKDAAELYKVKVPMRDGETMTLGELKDYRAQGDAHVLETLEWDTRRQSEQSELHRARAELAELIQAVPRDRLNPEALTRARTALDARLAIERDRTLAQIPEWSDDARRQADQDGMREYLADYGLPGDALSQIQDHRMILVIRDAWARKVRLDQALESVRRVSTPSAGGSSRAPRPSNPGSTRPGQQKNAVQSKVDRINNLLRGS